MGDMSQKGRMGPAAGRGNLHCISRGTALNDVAKLPKTV